MVWDQNGGQTYLFEDNFAFHRASLSVTVRKSHFQLMNLKKNVRPKIFCRFLYGPYESYDMIWFLVFCWKLMFWPKMIEIWIEIKGFLGLKMIKTYDFNEKIQFLNWFFFLFAATYWSLIYSRDFLKRKRRNNYAFVQTLLYKIRTEFTNINFIQCR